MATKKRFSKLEFGDIIYIHAPFEENTPDFYNGFTNEEVGVEQIVINGKTGKVRPVFVVDYNNSTEELHYLPCTTRLNSKFDRKFQYVIDGLIDGRSSGVELNQLRVSQAKPYWSTSYVTKVDEQNKQNITQGIYHMTQTKDIANNGRATKDQRGFVPLYKRDEFLERYKGKPIDLSRESKTMTVQDGIKTITLHESGCVHFHFNLTLEQVRERIGGVDLSLNL